MENTGCREITFDNCGENRRRLIQGAYRERENEQGRKHMTKGKARERQEDCAVAYGGI